MHGHRIPYNKAPVVTAITVIICVRAGHLVIANGIINGVRQTESLMMLWESSRLLQPRVWYEKISKVQLFADRGNASATEAKRQ